MSRERRRQFLLAAGVLLATPIRVGAQQRVKFARIGFLGAGSAADWANHLEAFRAGLRELGYVEGKNIVIEYRWADGKHERLSRMVADFAQLKVDVIVAPGAPTIQAAQQATSTIPIVMAATGDPVGAGFVASLARPGGNITGLSNAAGDVSVKYLELLHVAVPKLSRVAVLVNPDHPHHPSFLRNVQSGANTAGVTVTPLQARTANQIDVAFGAMARERAGALIVLPDPFFRAQARRIAEFAVKDRLPTMFWTRELVEAGGLMSYGQNTVEHFRRAATYVDKILKGAKPGDLPVEQPTKIELVINRRTAKALGLTIPQELLLRATEIIE